MAKHRLQRRRLGIWQRDFLLNRCLWPNIERAIGEARATARFTRSSLVLDVGCGHKPYRDHFKPARYLGMDWTRDDSSPDILGDACQIPVGPQAVDVVLSTQVIEHMARPDQLLKEFHRVLKPGGSLVLSGPMYWPLHEEPYDFFRFTKHGFAHLLGDAGFKRWIIEEDGGDWAQIMLAVNLKLTSRLAVPLRCAVNVAGMVLDELSASKLSPANYTIWAQG